MILDVPDFVDSNYFSAEPHWHLSADSPQELKKEFELYQNSEKLRKVYRNSFPKMKHPYYTWYGQIIDRG